MVMTTGSTFVMKLLPALSGVCLLCVAVCSAPTPHARAADHNDPNAVNSIFSDVDVNAADLYDIFGFPSNDRAGGEKVVVALTFASIPSAGVFDTDMLYRIRFAPNPRVAAPLKGENSLESMLKHYEAVKDKYLRLKASEVRVKVSKDGLASVDFIEFPGGSFSKTIDTNKSVTVESPDGHSIKLYIGGRDDAFFNDLPGFFRSINYAPQFYKVSQAMTDTRELKIPKTLLELEGNDLFNFDPMNPLHGQGMKKDLPAGPLTWTGDKFKKDAKGNYRFVYSGKDAQAGKNINAIILEIPTAFLTKSPETDRIINTWGESWVLKAAHKIETIPDERKPSVVTYLIEHPWLPAGIAIALGLGLVALGMRATRQTPASGSGSRLGIIVGIVLVVGGLGFGIYESFWAGPRGGKAPPEFAEELKKYKLIDTDGQPFADAALNEREDKRQLGAENFELAPHFVARLGHLGWGFGPSISALGLKTSFNHDNAPVSVHKTYNEKNPVELAEAFLRVKKTLFQELHMPDDSWNPKGMNIPLRRPFEIFIPNVCAIDMDTTGTWPFGRRLEDQVATRFLSMFLDMEAEFDGKKYHVELLANQALWDKVPIEPKTPPNPLKNDKPFLDQFPYLAAPWEK